MSSNETDGGDKFKPGDRVIDRAGTLVGGEPEPRDTYVVARYDRSPKPNFHDRVWFVEGGWCHVHLLELAPDSSAKVAL